MRRLSARIFLPAAFAVLTAGEAVAMLPRGKEAVYTPVDSLRHDSSIPVEWTYMVYDFGPIAEADGPRQGEFAFVNAGDAPVSVTKVKATCGCTSTNHILTDVQPGQTGWIRFTYDPAHRPGQFRKHIKVYFAGIDTPEELTISGTVIPSPETLGMEYPVEAGPLRCGSRMVTLGNISYGSARRGFIQVYNMSTDTVTPQLTTSHDALQAAMLPAELAPGEGGVMSIYLNTADDPRAGDLSYTITMRPDASSAPVDFAVLAHVENTGRPVGGTASVSPTVMRSLSSSLIPGSGATETVADGKEKKQKRKWFSNSYTKVKKIKKEEEKKKRKWFSNSYTEVKKSRKEEGKAEDQDGQKKQKRKWFSNSYTSKKTVAASDSLR